jgi:hypothetical protein
MPPLIVRISSIDILVNGNVQRFASSGNTIPFLISWK